jgi:hypothetical protein
MSTSDNYDSTKIPIKISAKKGKYMTFIYKRDQRVDCENETPEFEIKNDNEEIIYEFKPYDFIDYCQGVLRVLVESESGTPLAERLIFVKPKKQVDLKITTDYKVILFLFM